MRNAGTVGEYHAPGLPKVVIVTDREVASLGPDEPFVAAGTALSTLGTPGWGDGSSAIGVGNSSSALVMSTHNNSFPNAGESRFIADNQIYGSEDTVMPASVDVVVGLFLGRSA